MGAYFVPVTICGRKIHWAIGYGTNQQNGYMVRYVIGLELDHYTKKEQWTVPKSIVQAKS